MFDLFRFISPGYLFATAPGSQFSLAWVPLALQLLLFLIAVGIFVFLRVRKANPVLKRILRPIPTYFLVYALSGLLLILFRWGGAIYLSMRFLLLIWFVLIVIYCINLIRQIQHYPSELHSFVQRVGTRARPVVAAKPKPKKRR